MKKRLLILIAILLFPINVFALSSDYVDETASIVNKKVEENKVNLYLFHGAECPHCKEEKEWLSKMQEEYKDNLNIYMFEVWHDSNNKELLEKVKEKYNIKRDGVPLTVIGNSYYVGFSSTTSSLMENKIKDYIVTEEENKESKDVDLPILGNVDKTNVSLPLTAVILGFIDGFNPCAMWILLFLINMLFKMENKKKAWVLGLTFLFISGLVYFMSMLGINFVLGVATIIWIRTLIAVFILCAGIYNFNKYMKQRKKDVGCTVVDEKKRKSLIAKMKNITTSNSFIISLVGIIVLAVSVNLVELACSLGFPLIFNELLSINNVDGLIKIIYLLIYILFYMIDDIVVFTISMITLEATGITNKYNKMCTLVSSIIMIIMGILLIVKPEWLMLNF